MTCQSPTTRVGVVFDIDRTLADDRWRASDDNYRDAMRMIEDPPLEPTLTEARHYERKVLNADVVYLTGREQQLWTATKLWLSKQRLFAPLICRPPDVSCARVSAWKAQMVWALMQEHHWAKVTVYENNPETLMAIKSVLPAHRYEPVLVQADGDKTVPETKTTGLTEKDIVNFKILMARLGTEDERWKSLLVRRWGSVSELLDKAQDFITGRHRRRLFRRMVDEIWA